MGSLAALVFVAIYSVSLGNFAHSRAAEFTNTWGVEIEGGEERAEQLARTLGFVNKGKIILDLYYFEYTKPLKSPAEPEIDVTRELLSDPSVKWAEQQYLKKYSYLSSSMFNDTRWPEQWYIKRKDGGRTYNVIDVWAQGYTGKNVVVAVVDDGIDTKHKELANNYFPDASRDVVDDDDDPTGTDQSAHGTKCAGVIAGVANNNFCGVGIAYQVSLAGIRLLTDEKATDAQEALALSYKRNLIDVYSNSWGPTDRGQEVEGPGYITKQALKDGVSKGRNGFGSIYVFAAGNGGNFIKDSCSYDGYVNSIYTIAISGMNKDGTVPSYAEKCPGIMAVTYSYQPIVQNGVVITADKDDGCTDKFGSSSAAAAMASGLLAITLQANRSLTWRDVQHIVVRSARPGSGSGWTINAANLTTSDYFGFGLMDAGRMVELAKRWRTVPEQNVCQIPGPGSTSLTSGQIEVNIDVPLNNWPDHCKGEDRRIRFLEHVELQVNLNYTRRGDLVMDLISPSGTLSAMTHYRVVDSVFENTNLTNWVIMTLHFWGENPAGTWRLRLRNSQPDSDNTGILYSWTLIVYGTSRDPLKENSHVTRPTVPAISPRPSANTPPKGFSAGEIAGIIIGSAVVLGVVGIGVYICYRKYKA